MIDIIAFDADDTLWHNEHLYHQSKDKFAQILSDYTTPQVASRKLDQAEVRNIDSYGYGIKSFTLSMIETAVEVSNGQVAGEVIDQLITLSKDMLSANVELFDGVQETLARLSPRFDLLLITKGDLHEQERKIERSGIAQYFRYTEVVSEKTEATYRKILGLYHINPRKFLMVGNSLRSDILPVIRIGGRGVYIPYEQTWFHEQPNQEELAGVEYAQLEHFSQLPEFISTTMS